MTHPESALQKIPHTLKELYPFRRAVLDLEGGARYHYVDEGPAGAPPVLFLHGNPTWSFFFRKLVSALSKNFHCIAPDHIGMGLSSRPPGYSYRLENHMANAIALIKHLDLENITLVAHDWGGAIGMGTALRLPERFSRFVLMNTAAWPSLRVPLRIAACRLPLFGPLAVVGFNAFARAAVVSAVKKKLPPEVSAGYLYPYRSARDRAGIMGFIRDIPFSRNHPTYRVLEKIESGLETLRTNPVLLAWGMKDWCFSPEFLSEWKKKLPEAEVREFSDAGHYLLEDAGDEATTAVKDFLGV